MTRVTITSSDGHQVTVEGETTNTLRDVATTAQRIWDRTKPPATQPPERERDQIGFVHQVQPPHLERAEADHG